MEVKVRWLSLVSTCRWSVQSANTPQHCPSGSTMNAKGCEVYTFWVPGP